MVRLAEPHDSTVILLRSPGPALTWWRVGPPPQLKIHPCSKTMHSPSPATNSMKSGSFTRPFRGGPLLFFRTFEDRLRGALRSIEDLPIASSRPPAPSDFSCSERALLFVRHISFRTSGMPSESSSARDEPSPSGY